MKENLEAKLQVNSVSVGLNPFVEEFLARIVIGAVSSLKGAQNIRNLELYMQQKDVRIVLNGNDLGLTPFPKEIIANTLIGLISSLKEVAQIKDVKINIKIE